MLFIISNYELSSKLEEIISFGLFVVLIGFIDDRIKLSPSIKLILISFPVIFLILNGYSLNDLGYYEIIGDLNLGKFSIIFTILACGLLINSINYVDGIDGLLISTTISSLIYTSYLIQDENLNQFINLIILALLINLIFNFLPNGNSYKIFMGDAGSLFIGFFMSFLLIYLYKYQNLHPAYLIWVCWYPVYDFLFVSFLRLIRKKNVYLPDQTHFHHFLLKKLKSHYKATSMILFINCIIMFFGYQTTSRIGNVYSLILFFLLFMIFLNIRIKLEKSRGGAVW